MIFQIPASSPNSSYCNKPWKVLFGGTGINPEEVWIGVVRDHFKHWLFHMNKWTFLLHLFTAPFHRFGIQILESNISQNSWSNKVENSYKTWFYGKDKLMYSSLQIITQLSSDSLRAKECFPHSSEVSVSIFPVIP